MINLGRIKIPPLKNVLDVAMQTVRQQVPEKPGPSPRPPQNVRFANMGKILKEHFFLLFDIIFSSSQTYEKYFSFLSIL